VGHFAGHRAVLSGTPPSARLSQYYEAQLTATRSNNIFDITPPLRSSTRSGDAARIAASLSSKRAPSARTTGGATKNTDLIILLKQTNPDATILVDFPAQRVLVGDAVQGERSTVVLRMSSDNSNKFWQGKLNFTLAMAQGKVKLEGKRTLALKLLPLTAPLFSTYKGILSDSGRDDLLIG
jgi:putative sterol carrier protein